MVCLRRNIALLYILTSINLCFKASTCTYVHGDDKSYCTLNPGPANMKSADCDMGTNGSSEKKCTETSESSSCESNEISAEEKLKKYGYQFINYESETRMINIDDDNKGFEFDLYNGNRELNQQRYEHIGEIITELVYERLERDLKLEKVTIPVNAKANEAKGFFFKSSNALDAEKIIILIHGSGVVRAGQWARSLIINHSWESGTMEPYIKQAQEEGFGIIVTNGNQNYDGRKGSIKGSENPQDHFVYVWKHFIKSAKAKDIAVVAHSFGGVVVQHLVRNVPESMKRIKVVAFTDSVHYLGYREKNNIKQWFRKTTRNWVSSGEMLDKPITFHGDSGDCEVVSAGTHEHVWTSHYAKDSVFKYINEKLQQTKQSKESSDSRQTTTVGDDEVEAKKTKKGSSSEESRTGKAEDAGVPVDDIQTREDYQEGADADETNKLEDGSTASPVEACDKSSDDHPRKDESMAEADDKSSDDLPSKEESMAEAGKSTNDPQSKDESKSTRIKEPIKSKSDAETSEADSSRNIVSKSGQNENSTDGLTGQEQENVETERLETYV